MESTTHRVDTQVGKPGPLLHGHVAYHGYDVIGPSSGRHRGLPSPYLTFVVSIDEPLAMLDAHGVVRRDTVLGGLHDDPVTIVHDGRQHGVHVTIDPLAARTLFGAPAAALAGVDVDGTEMLGALARELHDRLNTATDWPTRFAALDEVLHRRADPGPLAVRDEVRWAWQHLVTGGTSVRAVAQEIGWSERHLGRRFHDEFGVGPKVAARMARFDRVRRRLAARALAGGPLGLADLAADGGYADQAHLAREFGQLAGVAPSRWVAEEVGNLQDAPSPHAQAGDHEHSDQHSDDHRPGPAGLAHAASA